MIYIMANGRLRRMVMSKIDLENATVNILLEVNGQVYMVTMDKDKYDAVSILTKVSAKNIIPTGKSQKELIEIKKHIGRGFEYYTSDGIKRVATCKRIDFHEDLKRPIFTGISPFGNIVRLTTDEIYRFI